ncbi:MAG: hypothetical protein IJR05_05005 [Acidaminococcaceae bacterium]|nr:hypothetical protein [Acidaminococcaceae bacterium]
MMDEMQKKLIETCWNEQLEQMLEDCLKENKELRMLFEKHPEKREEYKFKFLDSGP